MGNVSGIRFEPLYFRLRPRGKKMYFAGLRRLKVTRYSHTRGFKTASAALEYARRWAKKADRLINVSVGKEAT